MFIDSGKKPGRAGGVERKKILKMQTNGKNTKNVSKCCKTQTKNIKTRNKTANINGTQKNERNKAKMKNVRETIEESKNIPKSRFESVLLTSSRGSKVAPTGPGPLKVPRFASLGSCCSALTAPKGQHGLTM